MDTVDGRCDEQTAMADRAREDIGSSTQGSFSIGYCVVRLVSVNYLALGRALPHDQAGALRLAHQAHRELRVCKYTY